jgi:hypothetical protein
MRALRAGLGTALLMAACGDPAVDGAYEGQAQYELNGLVCATGTMDHAATAMGIAWTTLAPDATRVATTSGESAAIDASALSATFELPLFDAPPAGVTSAIRTSEGLFDVAIGIPVMFADLDGDGVLAQGTEPVLGVSRGDLVLYSTPALHGDGSEVALSVDGLPRGWSFGRVVCDDAQRLAALTVQAPGTRYDVWLLGGVSAGNMLETAAPKTCLLPF